MEDSCIGYNACYAVALYSGAEGDVKNSCGDGERACRCAAAYGGSFCDVSSSCLTF